LGYWKKHQHKDGEALLKEFDSQGWTISRNKGYYMVRCPESCGQHSKTVRLTPSGPDYFKRCKRFVENNTCWKEGTQ
jgi:hypothetical protein